jgi:hypothetical protein
MDTKQTKLTEAVAQVAPQRRTRETRVPVSGPRDILTISEKDANYVYRWVKDVPGRIQRFLDAGYEVVVHDAKVGQKTVDSTSRLGSALTRNTDGTLLVAMRILREWYDEDQASKQREIDSLEAAMSAEGGNQTGIEDRPNSKFSVNKPGR